MPPADLRRRIVRVNTYAMTRHGVTTLGTVRVELWTMTYLDGSTTWLRPFRT